MAGPSQPPALVYNNEKTAASSRIQEARTPLGPSAFRHFQFHECTDLRGGVSCTQRMSDAGAAIHIRIASFVSVTGPERWRSPSVYNLVVFRQASARCPDRTSQTALCRAADRRNRTTTTARLSKSPMPKLAASGRKTNRSWRPYATRFSSFTSTSLQDVQETTIRAGSPSGRGTLRTSFMTPPQEGQRRIARLSAKIMVANPISEGCRPDS